MMVVSRVYGTWPIWKKGQRIHAFLKRNHILERKKEAELGRGGAAGSVC
jgi:hypothetical protein